MTTRKGKLLIPVCLVLAAMLIAVGLVGWRIMRDDPQSLPSQPIQETAPQVADEIGRSEPVLVASAAQPDAGDSAAIATPSADVLAAIRQLESTRDPKCHSTACRFEDFIYGTPLSAEAREAKVSLQKSLIRHVWRAAARRAAAAGRAEIGEDDVQAVSEEVVRTSQSEDGALVAEFAGGDPIEISTVRMRQIASIAYSLRAILSVQQDALLGDAPAELPLATSGIDAMRGAVDVVTLSALWQADAAARDANSPAISPEQLQVAWRQLVPEDVNTADTSGIPEAPHHDEPTSEQLRSQLFTMIDGKLAAYLEYNEATPEEVEERFAKNVKNYYALYQTPLHREWFDRFISAYGREMTGFAGRLLEAAGESATRSDRALVRSADATAAVELLLPHTIDDFEDVAFFHRLPDEQVTLESYDCDSFRDTGFHWQFFRQAFVGRDDMIPPDPFAAEIITEAISGYGVLLLRVAGRVAEERNDAPALRSSHLEEARRRIAALASRHHASPEQDASATAIVSANVAPSFHENADLFFMDVTSSTGVDFDHDSAKWLHQFRRDSVLSTYPTFSGGGVAAEDIDGDGWIDLLFVSGAGNALYYGDGRGGFDLANKQTTAMISPSAEDGEPAEARQPLIADFDNDGRPDIFVSYANADHRVYRNLGERRFEDVTTTAGLGGAGLIGGTAVTFDFDNDGLLDLYTTYFGNYLQGAAPRQERDNKNALPNKLFRNLGGMKFQDVTEGSGTADTGWCQAVSHTDFDRDGRQDIIVANDFGKNALLRNLGEGRFENVASALGHTKAYHSMNVSFTDLNRDGFPDVYISNIATMVKDNKYTFPDVTTSQKLDLSALSNMLVKEANVLYVSQADNGKLSRYVPSSDVERGESSTGWAWDAEFFDFDNDGDDDLYVTNGSNDYNVYSTVISLGKDAAGEPQHFQLTNSREANVFYVNEMGKLKNRSSASGANFTGNSRSTAYLDWDNDGDLDIAVTNFHSPVVMLQNGTELGSNRWLSVRLIGDPAKKTNRDAIGARIVATGEDGLYVVREIQGGSGYLSQNPKEQHFGLGATTHVDLTIHWPNGDVQYVAGLAAGKRHVIRQGEDPEP